MKTIKFVNHYRNDVSIAPELITLSKQTRTAVSELQKFRGRLSELGSLEVSQKAEASESGDIERVAKKYAATTAEKELVLARVAYLEAQTYGALRADVRTAYEKVTGELDKAVTELKEHRNAWRESLREALGARKAEEAFMHGSDRPKSVRSLESNIAKLRTASEGLHSLLVRVDPTAWAAGPGALPKYDNGVPMYKEPDFDATAQEVLDCLVG